MPTRGSRNVSRRLQRELHNIVNVKTPRVIQQVMIAGMSYTAAITPIDTANLINSQYREMSPMPKGWRGRVGYTANYAKFVNDASGSMKGKKRKGSSGDYWSPNAEPDFVKKGFERDGKAAIKNIIKEGYKI